MTSEILRHHSAANGQDSLTPGLDHVRSMTYSPKDNQGSSQQPGSGAAPEKGNVEPPPPSASTDAHPVPPKGDMRDPKVFTKFFLDNFEIIDKSKDGVIRKEEITAFAQADHFKADPNIERQVDQSARMLVENYSIFGGMAPRPFRNITREDLNYYEKIMVKGDRQQYSEHWGDLRHRFNDILKSTHPTGPFVADPVGGLPRSDFSDGQPSDLVWEYSAMDRIEHLMPRVQNGDRAAAKLLQEEVDLVNRKSNHNDRYGVHTSLEIRSDSKLVSFERLNGDKSSEGYLVFHNPFETTDRGDRKNSNVKHSDHLFYTPDAPLLSITGNATAVYAKGTAFGEALGSMAEMNPQKVMNMIKDNGDGTCTVTFPGAPKESIRVPIRNDESVKFPDGESDRWGHYRGTWPRAMMDAYEVYVKRHDPKTQNLSSEKFADNDRNKYAAERALNLLTGGHGTTSDTMRFTTIDGLHKTLTNIKDNKQPALIFDTGAKEYRAVLDYDVQSRTMQYLWSTAPGRTMPYDLYTAEGPVKHNVRRLVMPKTAFELDKLIYPANSSK